MVITTVCLLSLVASLPQQPNPSARATAATAPTLASALPAGVGAALVVGDLAGAGEQLAATPIGQLWQQRGAPLLQQALAGEDAAALLPALGHGMALAFTGMRADGRPGLLLVVETGAGRDAVAAALQRLHVESSKVAGADAVAIGLDGLGRVQLVLRGSRLFAATHASDLQQALEPVAGGSLADDAGYRRLQADAGANGLLASLFVRTQACVAIASQQAPPQYAAQVQQAIAALGLARLGDVMLGWQLRDGELVGRTRCACPQLDGLLAAVVGTPGRLDPSLSRFVPAKADGFLAAAVDLGAVAKEVLALVAACNPDFEQQFAQQTAQLRQQLGFDLRRDVFDNFAGRVLCVGFAGADGDGHGGALIEVADGQKLAAVVTALTRKLPLPLRQERRGSVTMYLLPEGQLGRAPGFAVVDKQLVVADGRDALAHLVDAALRPARNAGVQEFLQRQPPATTWAGRSRDDGRWQQLLCQLLGAPPPPPPGTAAAYQWFTCSRDEVGVLLTGSSSLPQALQSLPGAATPLPVAAVPAPKPVAVPPAPAAEVPAVVAVDGDEARTLAAAEAAAKPDPEQVLGLLQSAQPQIAARAAWLCGKRRLSATVPALCQLLTGADDDGVRLQCAAALLLMPDKRALTAATAALADTQPRVRALAATLLGRLQSTTATEPLLALVDEHHADAGGHEDVVAALLALGELGTPAVLLPAASAVTDDDAAVGQALAWLFQKHSPALPKREESTLLLAVLDHPSKTLRRFAIQRLGELRDPAAAATLQGRLAVEDRDLQPVLQVALAALRDDHTDGQPAADLWQQAKTNVTALAGKAEARWAALDQQSRMLLLGCGALFLLGTWGLLRLRARARRRARADAAAALVAASPDLDAGDEPVEAEPEYEAVGAGDDDRY